MATSFLINTNEDLKRLATEMKREAMDDPVCYKPDYPTTKEAYEASLEQAAKSNDCLTRMLSFPEYTFTSVSLTFDKYEGIEHRWHLSMLSYGATQQQCTRDDIAKRIAIAFLGETYHEIPCEGKMIKGIRHFETKTE